jgi:hypothetical protein
MKTHLTLLFLIPKLVVAQLSYDTLLNTYKYNFNCFESLIVQGTPTKLKYHSKQKNTAIFQLQIDTIFHDTDLNTCKEHSVFILSNTAETSKIILESNLFVLRRCFYCDAQNRINCRPLLYYEMTFAARNESMTLELVKRQDQINPCINCEAIPPLIRKTLRPFKRNEKKWAFEKLNKIEKFIYKKK